MIEILNVMTRVFLALSIICFRHKSNCIRLILSNMLYTKVCRLQVEFFINAVDVRAHIVN